MGAGIKAARAAGRTRTGGCAPRGGHAADRIVMAHIAIHTQYLLDIYLFVKQEFLWNETVTKKGGEMRIEDGG